jgi:hypothetical protein
VVNIPFAHWPKELQRARRLSWALAKFYSKPFPADLSNHGGELTDEEINTAFRMKIGDLTATGYVADLHNCAELFRWKEEAHEAIAHHAIQFPSCVECQESGPSNPEPYFPERRGQ